MRVLVKARGPLRDYLPEGSPDGEAQFSFTAEGVSVTSLLESLSPILVKNRRLQVAVNGQRISDFGHTLEDGDEVVLFRAVGGG